jgi:hypothetical protein
MVSSCSDTGSANLANLANSSSSTSGAHLLANEEITVRDVVYTNILPTTAGMNVNQSQVFPQCLDHCYLSKAENLYQRYKGYRCGMTLRVMMYSYIRKYAIMASAVDPQ